MKKTIILMSACLLVLMSLAYASVTITNPSASSCVSGTQSFNVTLTGLNSSANCSFATTGRGVFANISVTPGNNTASTGVNTTNTTTAWTDEHHTTLTVICSNGTTVFSATETISIDNNNPVAHCTADIKANKWDYINYDCSASTDHTTLTYSCVATYSDTSTETKTSDRGYFESTSPLGEAQIACTVTDECSNTNTAATLTTNIVSDGEETAPTEPKKTDNTIVIVIVLVVALLIVALVVGTVATKKGKRRKR